MQKDKNKPIQKLAYTEDDDAFYTFMKLQDKINQIIDRLDDDTNILAEHWHEIKKLDKYNEILARESEENKDSIDQLKESQALLKSYSKSHKERLDYQSKMIDENYLSISNHQQRIDALEGDDENPYHNDDLCPDCDTNWKNKYKALEYKQSYFLNWLKKAIGGTFIVENIIEDFEYDFKKHVDSLNQK